MAQRHSITSTTSTKDSWDPGLQSVFDNQAGRRILAEVAAKKEIRKARLLFEASAQSQSPSKDFVSIMITELGIIWSKWKITLRGYTSGAAPVPQPQEEVMSVTDFKCNDTLLDEVRRVFGDNTFNHIERIIYGSNDPLSCTPEAIVIRICSMLDLQSISQLSQVNKYLRKVCMSDKLWGLLYTQHQGNPSAETCMLANDIGWKTVFYLSKIQLQKELSRRRGLYSSKLASGPLPRASTSEKNTLFPRGSTSSDKYPHDRSSENTPLSRGSTGEKNDNRGSTTSERNVPTSEALPPRASVSDEKRSTTNEDTTFLTEDA